MSPRNATVPGRTWRLLRRASQLLCVTAVLLAPLLGGWQRMDRARMATVEDLGWNLPPPLLQQLAAGEPAAAAHRHNRLLGGGVAASYFGIPAMDPLAGTLAMIAGGWSLRSATALCLPILLALLAGRVFCGWLCAFGVLSRALDRLSLYLPWLPRLKLPPRTSSRPLRFVLLVGAVGASLLGVHLLLYLTLPYVLLQQSVYAAWLLGGGSAILSVLLGLLAAGLLFGPNLYCAALCPTGAALGALGHARVVRLHVVDQPRCGSRCGLCDTACWLQLNPRSGDPGPDCDLCGRCVPVCPKSNLEVRVGRSARVAPTAVLALLLGLGGAALPAQAHGQADGVRAAAHLKPSIALERELRVGDTTVAISALDVEGTSLDHDWGVAERGTDISIYVTRGPLRAPGPNGVIEGRPFYRGPLRVELETPGRTPPAPLSFERANHPISAQRPSIYRRRVAVQLRPGDRIRLLPVEGYLSDAVRVTLPGTGTRVSAVGHLHYFLAALLVFAGLLSLSLVLPAPPHQPAAPAAPARRAGPPDSGAAQPGS